MSYTRGDDAATCAGKKIYGSWWAADRAARRLNRFRDNSKANPYRCPKCRRFHVGNTMGTMKERRQSRHTELQRRRDGRGSISR